MFRSCSGFSNRDGFFYHPFFAPILVIVLAILPLANWLLLDRDIAIWVTFIVDDYITVPLYVLAFLIVWLLRPKDNTPRHNRVFWMFELIIVGAFFRELGIQHWFSDDGKAALKISFFFNPIYPLHQKILAGLFIFFWVCVALWLILRYAKFCWKEFWDGNTVVWTILTTCSVTVFAKFMDRFADNYKRFTGEHLSPFWDTCVSSFEEIYEMYIPILLIIAAIQFARYRIRKD